MRPGMILVRDATAYQPYLTAIWEQVRYFLVMGAFACFFATAAGYLVRASTTHVVSVVIIVGLVYAFYGLWRDGDPMVWGYYIGYAPKIIAYVIAVFSVTGAHTFIAALLARDSGTEDA